MGLLQYGLIGSIALFAFYQDEMAVYSIASILMFYTCVFYYYVAMVMMNIKEISFDLDSGMNHMWQTRVIMGMGMSILFIQQQFEVFYFVLPFFIIGFVGDIFSTLLIMGQIELDNRDEPEE